MIPRDIHLIAHNRHRIGRQADAFAGAKDLRVGPEQEFQPPAFHRHVLASGMEVGQDHEGSARHPDPSLILVHSHLDEVHAPVG